MTCFSDIFGQDGAIGALLLAYRADRLPHGLIFAGPEGVGKGTTARALAGLFLCARPRGDSACGECESCRALGAENHPDFHLIYKELIRIIKDDPELKPTEIPVEVLRKELIEKANHKSVMGTGKVFLVEQADLMNVTGQNALLKTLEEPAGRTLIVLLTSQPDALLPTVRSRCRTIRFGSLGQDVVQRELEKRGVATNVAQDAAEFSEGSLGVALKWIDDGVIDPARDLVRQIRALLAGHEIDDLRAWFKNAAEGYAEKQLERDKHGSKFQATRDGMLLYLRILSQELRRQLRTTSDPEVLESLCAAIDAIAQSETYIDANVNVPVIFQQLSLKLQSLNR